MIAINLTVFVIFGMFLLFLWVTQRIILQPTLDVMDQRDDRVKSDAKAAEHNIAEAKSLERRYTEEMASVRRAASTELDAARREGMMARAAAVRERKAVADAEVQKIVAAAEKAVDEERKKFGALVPGLAERMAERLDLGGRA